MAKIDLTKYPPKEEQQAYLKQWCEEMTPIWQLECEQYRQRQAQRAQEFISKLSLAPTQQPA